MVLQTLHMAKGIDELEAYSVIPDCRKVNLTKLLELAKKTLLEAEDACRKGDEERAYVYFMRFFNLLNSIHKKPDYTTNKQLVRQTLGNNEMLKMQMDKLEELSHSLKRRYEQLNGVKSKITPSISIDTFSYGDVKISQKSDRLSAGVSPIQTPSTPTIREMNVVSCQELFARMKEYNVLVIDCRPKADYEASHLNYAYAFNVPEEIISTGMSAGKVQDKLDNEAKELWSARGIKDHVVLIDWSCKDGMPANNMPIAILRDILQNWDPDVVYRSPIQILQGGYEYFIMMYPTYCTNPSVQAPQTYVDDGDLIEEIEYPSIHDITMKDEISGLGYGLSADTSLNSFASALPVGRPSIDRSSKLAAIRTYEEKNKPIVEIEKEQEMLLQKAQLNDKQLEAAIKKWHDVYERSSTDRNRQELSAADRELYYHIMQLESAAEDNKIENNRLRDELERYKRLEREQQAVLTAKEQANLEAKTKEIETKIQERQRLDEQHEREKQERDRQLAIARETKRLSKPASTPDIVTPAQSPQEDVTAPLPPSQLPQFDRSIKPQISPSSSFASASASSVRERQRDFSPVSGVVGRGLTGLKNLGNTCYMNSILQCLSNTPQLTEYCITDKFKKHINRDNKTKGQIVEEVAALIKVLWNGNYKCVASKDLRYVIGQYQKIFRGIEQQDSHEFLTILMDWLHSDLQTLHAPIKPRDNITTAAEKAWLEFTKSKESLILHLFYGQIKSTVKCVQCHKESATYECFSNLSLELPNNSDVCHLEQCLAMYFSGEKIHGWNCPNCKQKRDAIKKLDISKLPPVLVIHLKRFYADGECVNRYRKKQNFVRFPLENLEMTPFIARSESRTSTPKTYQLYSVSNHYGTMESGHYTAFCKSGNFGRWFKFDDQVVTQLDPSNVLSSAAYILFYTWLPPIQINEIQ